MSNALLLGESLVSTIARAFYSDTFVVILEALIHEKFIIEEEIGPRLKLSAKEVRKITTQLEREMMIQWENVPIDGNNSFIKCYYIDYQLFTDVVRYRMHLMQKEIISEERMELNGVFYECPTCAEKYSSLEAQRLLSGDHKFICSHCCPVDNFRTAISEPFYRLKEIDNSGRLSSLQLLEKKLDEQMNRSKLHEGVFDLLYKLRDVDLPHNKPSDNIRRGVRTSSVTDDSVAKEIKQNFEYAAGSVIRKKKGNTEGTDAASGGGVLGSVKQKEFKINIESAESATAADEGGGDELGDEDDDEAPPPPPPPPPQHSSMVGSRQEPEMTLNRSMLAGRDTSMPLFLQRSGVVGAKKMEKEVLAAQQARGNAATEVTAQAQAQAHNQTQTHATITVVGTDGYGSGDDEQAAKRQKLSAPVETEEAAGEVRHATEVPKEGTQQEGGDGDDDLDDVEWEDD